MPERTARTVSDIAPAPWWRYRIAWLAMALPAIAVVASTLSAVIAVRHADPVVDEYRQAARPGSNAVPGHDDRRDAREPAERARNHASLPKH
jgi:uncharacterized protein